MTPAITASALIRFAIVETSISTRIRHTPEEQTDAARYVLNSIDKWSIDLHLDWWRLRAIHRLPSHHYYRSRCGGFGSFFIHGDEGLVEHVGDVEIIIWLSRRDLVEIGAASRNIERAFHSERLKFFRERDRRRFEFELWQMEIDVLCFELCALRQNVRGELRFQRTQTIYVVGKKDEKLKIVAGIRKTDSGEAFLLGVTKPRRFPHRRNIDRCAAANMK